jgi:hypothetical protein
VEKGFQIEIRQENEKFLEICEESNDARGKQNQDVAKLPAIKMRSLGLIFHLPAMKGLY